MDEPEKKDGIWVQTNNQYENIYLHEKYANYATGVWSPVSTLPYEFNRGSAVVYNNELHILGGDFGNGNEKYTHYHYKWNGSTWVNVDTLPYRIVGNYHAVVYNNEMHLIGNSYSSFDVDYHYKWNGSTWVQLNNTAFSSGSFVVYDNSIYGICRTSDADNLYKWNSINDTWDRVHYLPHGIWQDSIPVIYNGEIHVFDNCYYYESGSHQTTKHYKWNGSTWEFVGSTPYYFGIGSAVVYNNELHFLGGGSSNSGQSTHYHYKWNGSTWSSVSTLPCKLYDGFAVVYNGGIHIGQIDKTHCQFQSPEKVYEPNTLIINKSTSTGTGKYCTMICSPAIKNNQRFLTGFDDVFYFADTAFDWNAPMYYGNGSQWIKFKN